MAINITSIIHQKCLNKLIETVSRLLFYSFVDHVTIFALMRVARLSYSIECQVFDRYFSMSNC